MAKKSTDNDQKKASPFGDIKGEKFGGGNNYLQLKPGEVVHGLIHIKVEDKVDLGGGNDPVDLHVALDPRTGEEIRMPAAAIFRKNAEKAKLNSGDVYSVAFTGIADKKKGKGKGKPMDVWEILVTKRNIKK